MKKYITIKWLVLLLLVFFYNCETDSIKTPQDSIYKTVKSEELIKLFEAKNIKRRNNNYVNVALDDLKYEKLLNTDALVAVIPAKTKYKNYYSRLLAIRINNEVETLIFSMYKDNKATGDYFTGEILITDISGSFKKGFWVKNGITTHEIKRKPKTTSNRGNDMICLIHEPENPECILTLQKLEGVVIISKLSSNNQSIEAFGSGGWSSNNSHDVPAPVWNYGNYPPFGGSSGSVTSIEQENNRKKPCKKIKDQIKNLNFKAKIKELQKLTGKKQETGYVQNKDGTFTKLKPIKNGHSLDMKGINPATIDGYIHTHLNNFPTGEIDPKTGQEKINQIYRIFSPADVIKFLQIVKASQNPKKAYAIVITSTGDYTLKFTGDKSDIKGLKTAKLYEEDYIDYLDRYTNKERGFLHFLKDYIKIEGIELYKLHKPLFSSTIKIQRKKLNDKGKVDKVECEQF